MNYIKFLCKKLQLPTPVELGKSTRNALPIRDFSDAGVYTWEDWHAEVKAKYPVRYFLVQTIPHWFKVKITMNIEHYWYWFMSHTFRVYHKLDLRQPKGSADEYRWGWKDECDQVLFANFNILVNYIKILNESKYHYGITDEDFKKIEKIIKEEEQKPDSYDLEFFKSKLENMKELKALYDYWTVDRKIEMDARNQLLSDWADNRKDDTEKVRWHALNVAEKAFDTKEDDMLMRLIKIRRGFWT